MVGNNLKQILKPLWSGDIVTNETVMPISENGGLPHARLLFESADIISVRDFSLNTEYDAQKDYTLVRDGELCFPHTSRVPHVKDTLVSGEEIPKELGTQPRRGGGSIPFTETPWFCNRQTAVTYRHRSRWSGPVPAYNPELLPRTAEKIAAGSVGITLYGDSIAAGANSSSSMNIPPFLPMQSELIRMGLSELTGAEVAMTNMAVGGTDTRWGLETLPGKKEHFMGDVVILAFGMNDGTGNRPVSEYIHNISAMMDFIRSFNPAAEFVLVSCMCPNPLTVFLGTQSEYPEALRALQKPGTAVVDMWNFHRHLLQRKHYMDMTGNNINHPNDFLTRCYVMNILAVLTPHSF